MHRPEFDTAQVLRGYGQTLAAKQSVTCDAKQLPFPKETIKAAIEYYIRQEQDDVIAYHLEFAYQRLADFQNLTESEKYSVEVMENLQDTSDMSNEEFCEMASNLVNTGPVYHELRNRIWKESQQLQEELKRLRPH